MIEENWEAIEQNRMQRKKIKKDLYTSLWLLPLMVIFIFNLIEENVSALSAIVYITFIIVSISLIVTRGVKYLSMKKR